MINYKLSKVNSISYYKRLYIYFYKIFL